MVKINKYTCLIGKHNFEIVLLPRHCTTHHVYRRRDITRVAFFIVQHFVRPKTNKACSSVEFTVYNSTSKAGFKANVVQNIIKSSFLYPKKILIHAYLKSECPR